jgi:Ran-binding protein 1
MRQDKTMKVIANHPLDPIINLQPNVGSDRSWLWTTDDYSEGEYVETTFACRFQDTDKANEFKEQFLALQKEMETILQGKDKPGDDAGATAADEVAQALSALKTGEDAEEDDDDDDVDV